jgi:lipid-A-disaccharide synthase
MDEPLLFVAAGDPSGDRACARLITSLKEKHPGLKLFGLGGKELGSIGQEQLAEPSDLAVLGFWEVAKRYFFFRRLGQRCVTEIQKKRPKAILLVDYPGFNLRLAKKLSSLGIPIIYYISPQVWAWGKGRLNQIRDYINQMLVILPFEEKFYRDHGVPCKFVGHYLLEDIPREYIGTTPPGNGQIALLPGSRPQEIERMLPSMLKAATIMSHKHGSKAVVAAIKGAFDYESVCQPFAEQGVTVSYQSSRRTVFESDLVLTASGTATLETGIIGRPMVIVYKTGFLTYQIARRLVRLQSIGLVNLVMGKKVVPELIQAEASPAAMAAALEKYLEDDAYRQATQAALHTVPSLLGGEGASHAAAAAIGEYL